ncbi:MAG TPA: YidC/Oxa1 family membrane protein insertase, partial [Treponemataceae bacterium]|nr:YidC/Oxa1 family membrane protein insertase [Treponemataceae bacterium]
MKIFTILLWPFTTLITKVFEFSFFLTGNYGISLILVSFFITLITAPLYILADKWKAEELTLKNKMAQSLQSINTHYTGSKKFYLTKTLQKIWGYTSLHSFKTSFGLILQIPFFFGAYEALTHYSGYQGVGFLFLQDLSKADSLFFGLALMPLIMTLVNILSAAYYSRSFSWHKNKSLYIMAAVFLVLLYKSPSALLVYWTMNNVFSILKTFVLKKLGLSVGTVEAVQVRKVSTSRKLFFKNYKQALPLFFFSFISSITVYLFSKSNYIGFYLIAGSLAIIALVLLVYWIFVKKQYSLLFFALPVGLFLVGITGFYLLKGPSHSFSKTNYAFVIIQLELLLICAWPFYKSFTIDREKKAHTSFLHFVPVFAYLFFVVFYQPVKYYFQAPLVVDTILSHFLIKMGILFFVAFTLLTIIYKLVPKQAKYAISVFFLAQLLIALIYTSILKLDTGSIDGFGLHNPKVVNNMLFIKYLIDPFIITSLFLFASYLYKNYFNVVKLIISALSIAFILNLCFSYTAYKTLPLKVEKPTIDTSLPKDAFQKHIFSTTEQNVLFIISDMSNGNYIGRMIEEEPELIDALSGFIWYPDCLSISAHTSTSMSAMHSGWDYLPHKLADNGLTGQEEIEQSMRSFFNTILENKYDTTITDLEFFTMEEKPNLH